MTPSSTTMKASNRRRTAALRFGFQEVGAIVILSLAIGYFLTLRSNVITSFSPSQQHQLTVGDSIVLRSQTQVSLVTNSAATTTTVTTTTTTTEAAAATPSNKNNNNQHENSTQTTPGLEPLPTGTPHYKHLKIAWLMSYPNSGTSYTVQLVRHLSRTQTATNYGEEIFSNTAAGQPAYTASIPIFANANNNDTTTTAGPFYSDPGVHAEYPVPERYILTKTHCGGRCVRCGPTDYLETTYSFRLRCLTGSRAVHTNRTVVVQRTVYPPTRVRKAVHLIRDPFDNVVSRFNLERRSRGGDVGRVFAKDREGFRAFCFYLNNKYRDVEQKSVFLQMNNGVNELTSGIPCRSEFFRYMEWHNLALVTTRDLGLETYVLYYDWYSSRFDQTVDELFSFLELPKRGRVRPFVDGKFYRNFYTEDERNRMVQAMEIMASPPLWKHLERFLSS